MRNGSHTSIAAGANLGVLMTDLRHRWHLCRIGAGLGEQQPNQTEAANGHGGQTPKRETTAEMIQDVARKRGAERGADADRAADNPEPQVEPPGGSNDYRAAT